LARGLCVLVLAIGTALAGLIGTASAANFALAVGDQLAKTANSVRNFDWSRPQPDEIAPNPRLSGEPRPHIRDVGPWSVERQSNLRTPSESRPDSAKMDESTRAWFARWERPRPEDITPNPRVPWGSRPYLRSVNAGYAENQGHVRDYSSAASKSAQQRRIAVAGGASKNEGSGAHPPSPTGKDNDRTTTAADQKPGVDAKADEKTGDKDGDKTTDKTDDKADDKPGAKGADEPPNGAAKTDTKIAAVEPPGNEKPQKNEPGSSGGKSEPGPAGGTPTGTSTKDQQPPGVNAAAKADADGTGGGGAASANSPANQAGKTNAAPGDKAAATAGKTAGEPGAIDGKADGSTAAKEPGKAPGGVDKGATEGSPQGTTTEGAPKSADDKSPAGQEGSGDKINPDKKNGAGTKTALANRDAGPEDGPPGAGGSIADISAAIRHYLNSGAQSAPVDVSGDLAGKLATLFQTHPPDAPAHPDRADAQAASKNDAPPHPSEQSAKPDPAKIQPVPNVTATPGSITVAPGRIEFSGKNPSIRGDIR
jgi:hypothetical protein